MRYAPRYTSQNASCHHNGVPYGHHDPSRPPLLLPQPPDGKPQADSNKTEPSRAAGIHAIEAYVPRNAVKAATLEKAHGVDGKYTQGLMMNEFCGTGEDEDPVSIGLTCLSRLMYRYNIKFEEVGMMYVGSESLLDRAKSIKSNLMMLFNEHNCFDVEGCDTYNACYGGTAALLNCMNWISSTSWDGRFAITVATDIADSPAGYRFMTGCACVSMLVGVDAALVFERERCTHIINRWDFYKPWGWHVMAPIVDGPGSIDVYYECLDGCQRGVLCCRDQRCPMSSSAFLAAACLIPDCRVVPDVALCACPSHPRVLAGYHVCTSPPFTGCHLCTFAPPSASAHVGRTDGKAWAL